MDDIDMESMDWILAMQFAHIAKLRKEKDLPARVKVALLGQFSANSEDHHEIIDPMGKRISVFEKCYQKIDECIRIFLETEGKKSAKPVEELDTNVENGFRTFQEWAEIDEEVEPTFEVINGDALTANSRLTFREIAKDSMIAAGTGGK